MAGRVKGRCLNQERKASLVGLALPSDVAGRRGAGRAECSESPGSSDSVVTGCPVEAGERALTGNEPSFGRAGVSGWRILGLDDCPRALLVPSLQAPGG